MDEKPKDTSIYRDQSKRDRTPTWQWVRMKINKAHTDKEWVELFKSLSPDRQIDAWLKVNPVPKEIIGKMDNTVNVKLILSGIEGKPTTIPIQAIDTKALMEHEETDD